MNVNTTISKYLTFCLVLSLAFIAGCQDLSVENKESPNRDQVLATPQDVQNLAGGTFLDFWTATQWCGQSPMLATMADTYSCNWANWGMNDMSSEPRIAWNNDPSYARAASVEDAWFDNYVVVSNAADVLKTMNERGDETFSNAGVNPNKLRAFVNFTMGLAYGQLAATFDRAFLADETTDLVAVASGEETLELRPYSEVKDFAIAKLDKAINIASSSDFQITAEEDWIFGLTLSSDDLVQLANSYKARFEAWNARTPQERQNVDWNSVMTWIQQGMEADDYAGPFSAGQAAQSHLPLGFAPIGDDQGNLEWDCTKWVGPQEGTWSRADYRMIGPADVSGGYEDWLDTPVAQRNPFVMDTPDRRILGPDSLDLMQCEIDGTCDEDDADQTIVENSAPGKDYSFQGTAFTAFPPERGTYHYSDRTFERYQYYANTINGPMPVLTKPEMDLLKAEALLHTGGDLGTVADLINNTRADRGELPPATASTPVGSIDDNPNPIDQSPADDDPVTLWSMLKYEYNMEVQMTASGAVFFTDRGWGDLVEGTPLHFPVAGAELETLELQIYTFGGVGGPCSAGNPSNCVGSSDKSARGLAAQHLFQGTQQRNESADRPWGTR